MFCNQAVALFKTCLEECKVPYATQTTSGKDVQSIYQAALKATEKLGGKIISSALKQYRVTARFPKVILGETLGERIELSCEVRANGDGGIAVVDAFPLDAVERKLMFGARPGVTLIL